MTKTTSPMKYDMFVMPIHDPTKPPAQCYDEDLELAVKTEELGFGCFWVGEHHSSTYENIVMPEIFLGKVLGVTKTIRLGPAPVCLQYHNPVHIAGRLAFLDHLSHGRLNVCFGPGAVVSDLETFAIDPRESGARVVEAIDMILKIWTSDPPYQIDGNFWNLSLCDNINDDFGIGQLPKPLQQPYPSIYVPVMNRGTPGLHAAAARGFLPISHHMLHTEVLIDQWKTYREGAESAGRTAQPGDWSVSRNILVADSTEEARKLARENSVGKTIQYVLGVTGRYAPTGLDIFKRNADMTDAECNMDYFMDEVIIAGDPDTVTQRLLELYEQVGGFGTLVVVAHDWDDRSHHLRSLDLIATEVVPAVNRAIGAAT